MSLLKSTSICTAFLAALPWSGAAGSLPNTSQKTQFVARLKTMFAKADLNQDDYLDKAELAKSFRGPKATPPTQGMYDDRGNPTPIYYQARSKYPDLVFLWAADTDGDDLVSWPEYQKYGMDLFANMQKQQQALQRAMQSASRQASRPSRQSARGTSRQSAHGTTTHQRQPVRHARTQQHAVVTQQQQMASALQNWQRNVQHVQAAYQQALRRRWQVQQQLQQRLMNYRRQQAAAFYRTPQRHASAGYRRASARR